MNDEAATHYSAIIDNHKLGFEYLRNNFGKCGRTKIGWQIDPFGHSREQASLFAQFGFDGLFFGRLDYQDKIQRQKTKTMEMLWRGSPKNLGSKADLFTGVLPNMYQPPSGFWFDAENIGDVIMDDPSMHDYNVQQMVDKFIVEMKDQASWYATNHLITTMGSDFNYVQAHMWFKELDKLIKYVNARQAVGSNINLLYSTPSCYLNELHKDNRTWPTKEDDFFPYADRAHGFWTGYFTSRPAAKHYIRVVNGFFQATKQIAGLAKLNDKETTGKQLHKLAAALGAAQHHDAVTGTAKQDVAYDYNQRLSDGVDQGEKVIQAAYDKWMPKSLNGTSTPAPTQVFCHHLNISMCSVTENLTSIEVHVYNPLARPVQYYVRIPVTGSFYTVIGPDGRTPVVNDVFPISPGTAQIPLPRPRVAEMELVFRADVPALGFTTYFVSQGQKNQSKTLRFQREHVEKRSTVTKKTDGLSIQGKLVKLDFDSDGNVKTLTNLRSNLSSPLTQAFMFYEGIRGNNSKGEFQASGAYIFRPVSNTPYGLPLKFYAGTQQGQLIQEAYQQVNDWISQVYRVYEDKPYVEVEWTVGPIPVDDMRGKEVVTRYNLKQFNNNGTFYTDANGRELQKRVLNHRPTWALRQTEAVSGNYYPVDALISVMDEARGASFTVLTDRAQGGTSLNEGDIELMLHRRLMVDDGKGVGEALNETGRDGKGLVIRGSHYLMLEPTPQAARGYRPVAQEVFMAPLVALSESNLTPDKYVKVFNTQVSGLKVSLPKNVHLLTFDQFFNGGVHKDHMFVHDIPYLVRFEHFYEADEDAQLSTPVTFDLKDVFNSFTIEAVHELSLGANIPVEEVHRLQWRGAGGKPGPQNPSRLLQGTTITLGPMDIVTLQVDMKHH